MFVYEFWGATNFTAIIGMESTSDYSRIDNIASACILIYLPYARNGYIRNVVV